jgi:hypothetical protein
MSDVTSPDHIGIDELRSLAAHEGETSVSLYVPTTKVAVEAEENSLHLKNLLVGAEEKLEAAGLKLAQAGKVIAPLKGLLEDKDFWRHQLDGLALFATAGSTRSFRVATRVPELAVVSDSFYVKPLLSAAFPESRFYVLAISQNHLRLLHCTRYAAQGVDLSEIDMPMSLAEALRYDDLQGGELQHHPTTGPGRTARGGKGRMFHGHGEAGDSRKTQIRRFFQAVDAGLAGVLRGEGVPLVLAAVDYLHPLFKEVSGYRPILERGVEGSPDRLRPQELWEKGLRLMEERWGLELAAIRERYGGLLAQSMASADLSSILGAAHDGRIDTLLLSEDCEAFGRFDPLDRVTELHDEPRSDSVDLWNLAVRRTLLAGGTAHLLRPEEMPDGARGAALYRY